MTVSCPSKSCVDTVVNITYDDLLRHLQTSCPSVQVTCPTKDCRALLKRSDLKAHLLNGCNNFEFECPTCNCIQVKSQVAAHSCI